MQTPSRKPKNLTELARVLGVSRTLVSQVANNQNTQSIKPETRARILAAIQEYEVSLTRKAARQVCVVEVDRPLTEQDRRAQHPYFGERINQGIRRVASEENYALSFVAMKDDWQDKVRNLAQTRSVSGILMIGHADAEVIEIAQRSDVPTVLVDCSSARVEADSVEMDQSEMVRLAVEVLVRRGAKKVAFLHPETGHPNDEFRRLAFHYHLSAYGLAFHQDLVVSCVGHIHGGQTAMSGLICGGRAFDAVIGSGDYATAGALFALQAAGRQVPNDVQLISIGGDPICYTVDPSMANVDGGAIQIGERGMHQLLQRIESPASATERVLVRPVFHDGGSLREKSHPLPDQPLFEARPSTRRSLEKSQKNP